TCQFEATFCDWELSDKDNLRWSFQAGPTPTRIGGKILTGPENDHTMGTSQGLTFLQLFCFGCFCFLIYTSLAKILKLYLYYMHGLSMGSLSVLMWSNGQDYPGPNAQSEWRVSGEKGDLWIYQKVSLRNSVTPYKVTSAYPSCW
ncbi:hypothetical protein EGW08_020956, partial [Elysia chlorotica]